MELCVALDLEQKEQNLSLVRELKGFDIWLKVGLRSYRSEERRVGKEC